jgi:hypothetical protein
MKELLYEKITTIIEQKNQVLEDNKSLKEQIIEANLKIDFLENKEKNDLIEKFNKIIDS